jgi:hypothetical protein
VAGEIGRVLGLRVPEVVFMELDANFWRSEPDPEIHDLLKASVGLNVALDFLPGALTYDPLMTMKPEPTLASAIVWFDAYITNVDRTARNTNMLLWHKNLWLIDQAASLYFHHAWGDYLERSRSPFKAIKDHVLLPFASEIAQADTTLKKLLTPAILENIVGLIPDDWLAVEGEGIFASYDEHRAAYLAYLLNRLEASEIFVEEAVQAHAKSV